MANENTDILHQFHGFINDFWKFAKARPVAENDDAWWDAAVDEAEAICKEHAHPAVVHIMSAYMDYLEHEGSGKERRRFGE